MNATYRDFHCESPLTSARTERPSTNLPVLYVKSQLAEEREQSCALTVSRAISSELRFSV